MEIQIQEDKKSVVFKKTRRVLSFIWKVALTPSQPLTWKMLFSP